jgi:hypothetical protein
MDLSMKRILSHEQNPGPSTAALAIRLRELPRMTNFYLSIAYPQLSQGTADAVPYEVEEPSVEEAI